MTSAAPIVLRPYQDAALEELGARWVELHRRGVVPHLLLVSRTGTGKTVIAGAFLSRVVAKGRRVLVIVRDLILIDQMSAHLDRIGLTDHGVVAAGHPRSRPEMPIQICSAQTLVARGDAPPADVLVFDEAHGLLCETSLAILAAYPRATVLGLTATPERSDGKPMGDVFNALVQVRATFAELVRLGALVPVRAISAGGRPTRELTEDPIHALARFAPLRLQLAPHLRARLVSAGRKVVVYGSTVAHATAMAEGAARAGYRAAVVSGKTPAAQLVEHLERFELPHADPSALDVLTNCDLLTQGWDCPPVDMLILARGVSAWGPFMQMIGRALRPYPGKAGALVVDLRGSVYLHGRPDEDRTFSLTVSESQREKLAALPSLSTCLGCGSVYRTAPACPDCGRVTPPRRLPSVKRKSLEDVNRVSTFEERYRIFQRFCDIAKREGHKPGWVGCRYQEAVGRWPEWPIPGMQRARRAS